MAGVPAKKATAFTFYTALTSQADTKLFQANPTLAAGDVKISKDGGAVANPDTLPDAEPDAGYAIRVQLTATEMDADNVVIYFHDAAGAEWCDQLIVIQTDLATIGEIEAQTDDIGAAGAGLTALPWNAAWDTEVESEATDALNAYDPPTNTEMIARTLPTASYFDPAADAVATVTTVGTVSALANGAITAAAIATGAIDADALAADAVDEILDEVVEGTLTMRQMLRLMASFIGGKVSGGGTTSVVFRDLGDTKARITMTVATASGDRSAVTLDGA